MLFQAAEPERRYLVMQRFYRLPEPLIRRFYAGSLTAADRVRILSGRPPVPLRRALQCLWPSRRQATGIPADGAG
jgi:lycopene beta-cyclase